MLYFKELRVSPDGKTLIIHAAVDQKSFYSHVFIDSVVIDTQSTYVSSGPSNTPLYTQTLQSYDNRKELRLELDMQDLGVDSERTMFFVYIKSRGDVSPEVPCAAVRDLIMGTVINLRPIYTKALHYMKEMGRDCEIPKGFIDLILRVKALELAVRTGNYPQAIRYWTKFFLTSVFRTDNPGCPCGSFR